MVERTRFLAPAALAALSAVAALSLARVVDSGRFVLPVLGAALLPHALGALVRRRNWPTWSGVLLALVGVSVFVVVGLEASTTTLGVPSGDTWRALDHQLTAGWHLLRTAPAPAPATDGAVLLAVIAVWCMAAIADWLAFARQATLAAISPALVFFVWTSTLGTSDWWALLTIGFCTATGAFLLAQNLALLDRRRHWLVSQHAARRRWLAPAVLLGGAAVLVALVVAPAVPGAGSDPLLDVAASGRDAASGHSYRPSLAPFVDIGSKLSDVTDRELFTVRAAQPEYWRIAALDQYTGAGGGQWTLSAEGDGSVQVGLPSAPPAGTLVQHFDIGRLGERWLPAAYKPVAIDLDDTLVVRSSDTIVADAGEVSHLRYRVASELPPAAGTQFDAQQLAAMTEPLPSGLEKFTRVGVTAEIAEIKARAEQIVGDAGAVTPYEQAKALRDYFRDSGFVYDTNVDNLDNGSAILQFLQSKHGFCVQFASAYAVMARTLGIPARVAVGFTPGKRDAHGTYHVSSNDAHAWPEIYLNGEGWTHLFDPTPARSGQAPGGSALPGDPDVAAPVTAAPPTTAAPSAQPPSGTDRVAPPAGGTTPVSPTVPPSVVTPSSDRGLGPWLVVVVVLALVALSVFAYVAAVLVVKRRRRARRHDRSDPSRAVEGAWQEALDRLREASFSTDPAQTPIEVAGTVRVGDGTRATRPLHDLARAYSAARYGDAVTGPTDARDAWHSLDELEVALDEGVRWSRRWRRRLDLSSFTRR